MINYTIKAILLGFSKFEDDNIQNIPNVDVNMTMFYAVLKNELEVPEKNIHCFSNLSSVEDVNNGVGKIIDNLSKDDVLLFYYAGHGFISDKSGFELFWSHSKSNRTNIHRNGINSKSIMAEIKSAKSMNKIVILDCCHGGKSLVGIQSSPSDAINGSLERSLNSTEGIFAISAVDEFDVATFSVQEPEKPTHFTAALLESIKGNKQQTLDELYNSTFRILESRNQKLPQKITKNTIGDFTFINKKEEKSFNPFHTTVEEEDDNFLPLPKPKENFSVPFEKRNRANLYLNSALLMRKKGRIDECFAFLNKAIEENPFDPEIYLSFGITKGFVVENDLHGAIEDFEKVLKFVPNHPKALSNIGILQYKLGQYIEAEKSLEAAVKVDIRNAGIWTNLGLTKAILKRENAEESLKKAISLKPDYSAAYNNLGNLYKDKGQFKKATFYYKKALNIASDSYDAWNNLGLTYLEWSEYGALPNGKFNDSEPNKENVYAIALDALCKALEINDKDYRAYTNIIKSFLDIGDENGSEIVMSIVNSLENNQQLKHISFPRAEYIPKDLVNYLKQNYQLPNSKLEIDYVTQESLKWDDSTIFGEEFIEYNGINIGTSDKAIYEFYEHEYKGKYILGDEDVLFYHPNSGIGNQVYKPNSNGYIVFYSPNTFNSPLGNIVLIKVENIEKKFVPKLIEKIDAITNEEPPYPFLQNISNDKNYKNNYRLEKVKQIWNKDLFNFDFGHLS
jgi:tetratricopeptide (TPR) repeat protein